MPSKPWKPDRIEQRVADILVAIRTVRSYVADVSADEFLCEKMRQDATARQLLVIAEACDKIATLEVKLGVPPDRTLEALHPQIPWRAVRDMGIRIRHVYGREDPQVFWDTATGDDLERLHAVLEAFPAIRVLREVGETLDVSRDAEIIAAVRASQDAIDRGEIIWDDEA
jgi:uncharacterized protein with HEPN domain